MEKRPERVKERRKNRDRRLWRREEGPWDGEHGEQGHGGQRRRTSGTSRRWKGPRRKGVLGAWAHSQQRHIRFPFAASCLVLFAAGGQAPAHFCSLSSFGRTDGEGRRARVGDGGPAPARPRAPPAPAPRGPSRPRPAETLARPRAAQGAASGPAAGSMWRVRRGWVTAKRRRRKPKRQTNPVAWGRRAHAGERGEAPAPQLGPARGGRRGRHLHLRGWPGARPRFALAPRPPAAASPRESPAGAARSLPEERPRPGLRGARVREKARDTGPRDAIIRSLSADRVSELLRC